MDSNSQRLIYRYQNFSNVMGLLADGLAIEQPSLTEKGGIIQFYEMAFESGWKCLKDYFEIQGLNTKFPRETIKTGIQYEILSQQEDWMQALEDRNLSVHTYDEETANEVENAIRKKYYKLLKSLHAFLAKKVEEIS